MEKEKQVEKSSLQRKEKQLSKLCLQTKKLPREGDNQFCIKLLFLLLMIVVVGLFFTCSVFILSLFFFLTE
jgi:hypothetical protein